MQNPNIPRNKAFKKAVLLRSCHSPPARKSGCKNLGFPGGCRALNLRRVLGAGSPGDGDVNRREHLGTARFTVEGSRDFWREGLLVTRGDEEKKRHE